MIDIYKKINELLSLNKSAVIVTIVETKGHSPADPGAKMIYVSNGEKFGTVGGGALEHKACKKCEDLLKTGKNTLETYILDTKDLHHKHETLNMACGGSATLYYEVIGNTENILIFGGGHIGKALFYHLKPLDFKVSVFDSRSEVKNDFPEVEPLDKLNETHLNNNPYIIIATHSHDFDYEILKKVLKNGTNAKYIGIVASTNKFKDMKKQLKTDFKKEEILFEKIYAPVGLNIGGRSPHEIAFSIISEIFTVKFNKKEINNLRDKK